MAHRQLHSCRELTLTASQSARTERFGMRFRNCERYRTQGGNMKSCWMMQLQGLGWAITDCFECGSTTLTISAYRLMGSRLTMSRSMAWLYTDWRSPVQ